MAPSPQADDQEDDDEQPDLTIDEDQEDDQQSATAAAIQTLNMNALLELSLAAKLVEEHKQMFKSQLAKASHKQRVRKN